MSRLYELLKPLPTLKISPKVRGMIVFGLAFTASLLYIIGIYRPIYASQELFISTKEVSLVRSIKLLFEAEEYYLAALLFTFTIVLPVVKNLLLLWLSLDINQGNFRRITKWLKNISKWSMLDVFVVSVLLVNLNLSSALYQMELKDGIIYFSLSVILGTLAFRLLNTHQNG